GCGNTSEPPMFCHLNASSVIVDPPSSEVQVSVAGAPMPRDQRTQVATSRELDARLDHCELRDYVGGERGRIMEAFDRAASDRSCDLPSDHLEVVAPSGADCRREYRAGRL